MWTQIPVNAPAKFVRSGQSSVVKLNVLHL